MKLASEDAPIARHRGFRPAPLSILGLLLPSWATALGDGLDVSVLRICGHLRSVPAGSGEVDDDEETALLHGGVQTGGGGAAGEQWTDAGAGCEGSGYPALDAAQLAAAAFRDRGAAAAPRQAGGGTLSAADPSVEIARIEDCRDECPARVLCVALGVSPSVYHAWRTRPESTRKATNRQLLTAISSASMTSTANAMEPHVLTPPCGRRAGPSAGGASNASCGAVTAFEPNGPVPTASAPPTATTPCRPLPSCCTAVS